MTQLRRLLRQENENRLHDLLGLMRSADAPQRHGMNQIDVPCDQRGKGSFGMVFHKLPQ